MFLICLLLELLREWSALLSVQCRSFLTIMQYCQLCWSHAKPELHGLLKLYDQSNPSTYQIFVMMFFLLISSKFRSPHCNLTLKLSHPHCHLCWTNMLHQWRGHGWVWVGSNPPTFKKDTHEIFANPKTFLGGRGWGGRGIEREKAWAVSDCVKQTATSTRCYCSVQLRSLIYCSDHCRFWNPIQSRFA